MLNQFGIIATCAPSPKGGEKKVESQCEERGDFVEKYM
jgi:hypothetical protein